MAFDKAFGVIIIMYVNGIIINYKLYNYLYYGVEELNRIKFCMNELCNMISFTNRKLY